MTLPIDMIELGRKLHELLTAVSSANRLHDEGAILWATNEPVDRLLLVRSGVVARFRMGKQGPCIVALRYAGEAFYPHECSKDTGLATLGPSETLEADGAVLRRALLSCPRLATLYQRSLQRHERIAYEWLFRNQLKGRAGIAHFLCEYADRSGSSSEKQFVLPIFQKHVGSIMGISLMQVNRCFKSLEHDGLFTPIDIRTFLVDWAALQCLGEYNGAYLN